jgi:hypothetical protein
MKRVIFLYTIIASLLLFCKVPPSSAEAPRNPDSAKECAICHYRWVDTFFELGKGSDLVDFQSEKVVAKPEICFSCHDGSVIDSRARVYNDQHHEINKPPPPTMKIPSLFPLDKEFSATHVTPHTVSQARWGLKKPSLSGHPTETLPCAVYAMLTKTAVSRQGITP